MVAARYHKEYILRKSDIGYCRVCGDMELSTKRKLVVIVIVMLALALLLLEFASKIAFKTF